MTKEAIATGATVEEAKEAACRELGVESYDAEFEILQMPVKKTLGLFGGAPAKVRVFINETPIDVAEKYLRDVLNAMDFSDIEIDVEPDGEGSLINLSGENAGMLIGRRGETLAALQYLVGLAANHVENAYYRVTINIGDYREKREKTLDSLGRSLAFKAAKSGIKTELEPMNPYERRIIHTAVQKVNGAVSWSEGEDLKRHVVIAPDPDYVRPQHRNNGYGRGNRRGYNGGRSGYNRSRGGRPQRNEGAEAASRPPINEGDGLGLYGRIDRNEDK